MLYIYVSCVLQVGKGNMKHQKHSVILPVRMHARIMIAVTSVTSYTSKCCKFLTHNISAIGGVVGEATRLIGFLIRSKFLNNFATIYLNS